jgi:prepilin-type N-terminal cleavage/methylation domain-containing protein
MNKSIRGFTMVELVIVASIIGILAAIAIPNFLAARTRANVSKAKGEQEMLLIALQSYYVDKSMYPLTPQPGIPSDTALISLTTPTVYITRLPKDPFKGNAFPEFQKYALPGKKIPNLYSINGYGYVNYLQISKKPLVYSPNGGVAWFMLMSPGPNFYDDYDYSKTPPTILVYDPTNGTTTRGDVYVFGP